MAAVPLSCPGSTKVCVQVTDLLATAPICIDLIRNLQVPAVAGILPLVFSNKTVIDLKGNTNFTSLPGSLLSGVISPNLPLGGILDVLGLSILPDIGTITLNPDNSFTYTGPSFNGAKELERVHGPVLLCLPCCQRCRGSPVTALIELGPSGHSLHSVTPMMVPIFCPPRQIWCRTAGTTAFCYIVTDLLSTLPLCQTIAGILPSLPSVDLPVCLPGCLNGGA
jgi:hypothetical protein